MSTYPIYGHSYEATPGGLAFWTEQTVACTSGGNEITEARQALETALTQFEWTKVYTWDATDNAYDAAWQTPDGRVTVRFQRDPGQERYFVQVAADFDASTGTMLFKAGNLTANSFAPSTYPATCQIRVNDFGFWIGFGSGSPKLFLHTYCGGLRRMLREEESFVAVVPLAIASGATSFTLSAGDLAKFARPSPTWGSIPDGEYSYIKTGWYVGQKLIIQNFAHDSASANKEHIKYITITSIDPETGEIGITAPGANFDAGALVGENVNPILCGGYWNNAGPVSAYTNRNSALALSSTTAVTVSEQFFQVASDNAPSTINARAAFGTYEVKQNDGGGTLGQLHHLHCVGNAGAITNGATRFHSKASVIFRAIFGEGSGSPGVVVGPAAEPDGDLLISMPPSLDFDWDGYQLPIAELRILPYIVVLDVGDTQQFTSETFGGRFDTEAAGENTILFCNESDNFSEEEDPMPDDSGLFTAKVPGIYHISGESGEPGFFPWGMALVVVNEPPEEPEVDTTEPTLTVLSPLANTTIAKTTPVNFEVTDAGGLRRVMVVASFPGLELLEVVHDGNAFGPRYQTSENVRTVIDDGFRYAVLRRGGWPMSPTLRVYPIDTSGNEAE